MDRLELWRRAVDSRRGGMMSSTTVALLGNTAGGGGRWEVCLPWDPWTALSAVSCRVGAGLIFHGVLLGHAGVPGCCCRVGLGR